MFNAVYQALFLPFSLWAVYAVHSVEEIITMPKFMSKNRENLTKRYPRLMKIVGNPSRQSFIATVVLLGLIIMVVTGLPMLLMASVSGSSIFLSFLVYEVILYAIWLALMANFVMHIVQSVVVRMYTPGLVTAVLFLILALPFVWHVLTTQAVLSGISVLAGIVAFGLGMTLIKFFMPWFDEKYIKTKVAK